MDLITVLLAEDHQVVREGIRSLLEREADIKVVAEASTGRQAVQLTRKLRPSVVVMDIAMPLLNGLEATRKIQKAVPDTKVLILSAHSDDAYVEQAALIGATGFLLKQTSSNILTNAIRQVRQANIFCSQPLVKHLYSSKPLARRGRFRNKANHLSSREVELLRLVAEGKSNKQVAAELGVSFKTVDKQRQNLMAKLNIHDVASLTRYAVSAGIIETRSM